MVDFVLLVCNVNGYGVCIVQCDFGCNGGIQQFMLNVVIVMIRNVCLFVNVICQQMVEIIVVECGIIVGCQYFKYVVI